MLQEDKAGMKMTGKDISFLETMMATIQSRWQKHVRAD